MSSMTFVVEGPIDTQITISENADGSLTFVVTAINGGGQTLDYRALFFDIASGYEGLLAGLTTDSAAITDEKYEDDSVNTLGQDANINGEVIKELDKFDIGVEVGTSGMSADDYSSYSFTLSHATEDLTLAMFSSVDFGVRATSVGFEGARDGSFKAGGQSPQAPGDDCVFVESGDTVLADVLGNDDPRLDASTLAVSGDDNGTASIVSGEVQYVAADIAGDTTDDSVADAMIYTAQSTDGTISVTGDLTVKVIDPLVETEANSTAFANGQAMSLTLSTEDRTYNTTSFVDVGITVGDLSQNVNVSFAIDGSGSLSANAYLEEMQAVQDAIDALRLDFGGSIADVEVQLVQFGGVGTEPVVQSGVFDLFDAALDNVASSVPFIRIGGTTPFEAALQETITFFAGKADEDNFLFFASDGIPNIPDTFITTYQDEVVALDDLNVQREAFGFDGATQVTLDAIDSNDAELVNTASEVDFTTAGALFLADLFEFSLTLNGVEVADETNLTDDGLGNITLTGVSALVGLDNSLGAANEVVATAKFDLDGDLNTLDDQEIRTATTIINGTDGTDIFMI